MRCAMPRSSSCAAIQSEPARPAFGISIGCSVATETSVRSRSPRASKFSWTWTAHSYGAGGHVYGAPATSTSTRPPSNSLSASAAAGTPAKLHTSCPCSASPGTRSGRGSAPSAITSRSPSSRTARRFHPPRRRVDLGDLRLDELDAVAGEPLPRTAALGDRAEPGQLPQLAQSHRKLWLTVDEHELVVVPEQPPQLDGRRDAAETAAEDERTSAQDASRARATTSSSVGANLSMNCCTRPIRSLNSGWVFQRRTASMSAQPMKLT